MRVSDSYVSTVIILAVFATRKSTLSPRVVVSCFFFWWKNRLYDALSARSSWNVVTHSMKSRRVLCVAGFLLSAAVSYSIGYIFMSIDTRISPIGILFPSSFLQSSWLEVQGTVSLCSPGGSVTTESIIWGLRPDETSLFFPWRQTAFASMHGGIYARLSTQRMFYWFIIFVYRFGRFRIFVIHDVFFRVFICIDAQICLSSRRFFFHTFHLPRCFVSFGYDLCVMLNVCMLVFCNVGLCVVFDWGQHSWR